MAIDKCVECKWVGGDVFYSEDPWLELDADRRDGKSIYKSNDFISFFF